MAKKTNSSFGLTILGFILIFTMTIVLFSNEGNHVAREKAIKHIKEATEITQNDTNYEGGMVIFSGIPNIEIPVMDPTFLVTASDGLILKRNVSSYQWIETAQSTSSDTTYIYEMAWSDDWVNSNDFLTNIYENPPNMLFEDATFYANQVTIGAYRIGHDYIDQFTNTKPLEILSMQASDIKGISLVGNQLFVSLTGKSSYDYPALGDCLISFDVIQPELVTVLGKSNNGALIPYATDSGPLAELAFGELDKPGFMALKFEENNSRTWALRFSGIIGLIIGFALVFTPIKNTVGKVPILGNIVNMSIVLISVVSGIVLGLLVIAIGWLFFKPLLSISFICLVAVGLYLYHHSRKFNERTHLEFEVEQQLTEKYKTPKSATEEE